MLIKEYEDYLKKQKLSERTVKIYKGRISALLSGNYSENDLKGAVNKLIEEHSKGGIAYSEKDRGTTRAALCKLRDMLLLPYADFMISYEKGFSSFEPKGRYVSAYKISKGKLIISYNKGHMPFKTIEKNIPKDEYCKLIDMIIDFRSYLSASDTAKHAFHSIIAKYDYVLDEKHLGNNCAELFEGKNAAIVEAARKSFSGWIKKFIPEI